MIALALAIGHSMTAGGRIGNALRRAVVPRARLIPVLGAKVLDSRTPDLGRSALVNRGRGRRQLAGSLCPNAATSTGDRFDDVVGRGFAFVTSVPPSAEQQNLIAQRNAALHYAAPGTELADWLHRGRAQAAIVRPDFTVLRDGRDLADLCEALPALTSKNHAFGH
jgi:3-(3-hydroxy-phenyl)propionate hydroxylase